MSAFNAPKLNTADTLVALGFWKSLGALAAMASYVSLHLFLWVLYSPFRTASNIAHGVMVTISVKCRSEAVWSIFCDGNSYGCDAGIFIFLRTLHIPITESTDDDNNNAWAGPESILQSTHSTHTIMSRSTDIWTCVLCRGPPWRKSKCFTSLLIRIFFWMKLIYLCQRSFETLHSSPGLNGWGQWTVLCW